jgi:hypothetical protein
MPLSFRYRALLPLIGALTFAFAIFSNCRSKFSLLSSLEKGRRR